MDFKKSFYCFFCNLNWQTGWTSDDDFLSFGDLKENCYTCVSRASPELVFVFTGVFALIFDSQLQIWRRMNFKHIQDLGVS